MQGIVNSFAKGQQMGMADEVSDNLSAREIHNLRFMDAGTDSFVLASFRGTEQAGQLPNGFRYVGHAVYGGIAYMVLHNDTTKETELGSFPSPAATGNTMAFAYRALQNYKTGTSYGTFRTTAFNFTGEKVQVRIQPDYDGSVNMILNDRKNPPSIVNTGFAVTGDKVTFPDRSGTNETNRYDIASFKSRVPLIQKSGKIIKLDFLGVFEGGRQKAGNYHYYFRYGTQDGNTTDVSAESMTVAVMHGTTVANTRGGKGDGEDTNKVTRFRISNLDTSFRYLYVSFVHTTGETAAVKSAYTIEQPILITGTDIQFSHTGFEEIQRIDINELSVEMPRIASVGSIEQAGGHLMLGDIKEQLEDYQLLQAFTQRLKLGYEQISVSTPGTEDNLAKIYSEPIGQETKKNAWSWNGGYANPKNVYHRGGYFGGETYCIAARYIFEGGFTSPAFPCLGYDQLANNVSLGELNNLIFDDNGVAQGSFAMANNRGVFRFPLRNATATEGGTVSSLQKMTTKSILGINIPVTAEEVNVLALAIELPASTDPQYMAVRAKTIGIQFVRSERKPDVLTQGALVPTYSFPSADMTQRVWDSGINDRFMRDWFDVHTGSDLDSGIQTNDYLNGDKRRVLPLLAGEIEGAVWNHNVSTAGYEYFDAFSARLWDGFADRKRFGLYSFDLFADNARMANLVNNRAVSVSYQAAMSWRRALIYNDGSKYESQNVATNSLWQLGLMSKQSSAVIDGTAYYSPEGIDQTLATNGRFGSYIGQANLPVSGGAIKIEKAMFGQYVGLHLPQATLAAVIAQGNTDCIRFPQDAPGPQAYLVNIYNGGSGPFPTEAVWANNRNLDDNAYFAITPRLYWDDAIGAEQGEKIAAHTSNGRVIAFGGDCFVGYAYQRLFFGDDRPGDSSPRKAELVGRGIMLLQESKYNMYARTEEMNVEAEARSFFPYHENKDADKKLFFRRNKLPEAISTNFGYGKTGGDQMLLTLPQGVPYIGSRWFSRIIASGKHIPNSFENGYRIFSGLAIQDYPSEHGPIRLLQVVGDKLLCFFQNAIAIIPVNERVQTASDSAGAIFIDGAGLLSPQMGLITREYGAPHPFAVVVTDNYAYVPVQDKAAIIRVLPQLSPVQVISDVSVSPILEIWRDQGNYDVVSFFDKQHGEVLFSFIRKGGSGQTLAFSEKVSAIMESESGPVWAGFRSYVAQAGLSLGKDILVSISAQNNQILHQHDKGTFSHFYGKQEKNLVRFVTNPRFPRQVVYNNQQVESNNILPKTAEHAVSGGRSMTDVKYDPTDPVQTNAKRVRGTTWLIIPSVQEITDQSPSGWVSGDDDNADAEFQEGSRMRGKQLETILTFDSPQRVMLNKVTTFIQ